MFVFKDIRHSELVSESVFKNFSKTLKYTTFLFIRKTKDYNG